MRRRWRGKFTARIVVLAILIVVARAWVRSDRDPRGEPPSVGSTLARTGPYPVVRVVDGDTLHVEIASSPTPIEKVRLLRVNTPERDEPGYERATAALKGLVEGRQVELVFEPEASGASGKAKRDEYGRLLAYVLLGDVHVNVELVRRGWSRFFTKYGEGAFGAEFRAAEETARAQGEGLWDATGWNVAVESSSPRPSKRRRQRGPFSFSACSIARRRTSSRRSFRTRAKSGVRLLSNRGSTMPRKYSYST